MLWKRSTNVLFVKYSMIFLGAAVMASAVAIVARDVYTIYRLRKQAEKADEPRDSGGKTAARPVYSGATIKLPGLAP